MTHRCAVLDDYQGAALTLADWSRVGEEVEIVAFPQHFGDVEEMVAAVQDFDIVVVMRERTTFDARVLSRLPQLRLLVTSGMRNAAIDMVAATAQGVVVCGTASFSEPPVELTWALIMALARKLTTENAAFRAGGPWQSTLGTDLFGSRLGLLGLGKLGSRVAHIGQAFGMDVTAWSENLTQERAAEVGVALSPSKAELLATSDFVSIHLMLSDRTRGLLGPQDLALMRLTAYLINTSRAAIVDQDALVDVLRAGRIAGVGLDVYEEEPLPDGHVLRSLPNVLATPHLGYVTRRNYQTYFREAVEDIEAFLAGAPVRRLA